MIRCPCCGAESEPARIVIRRYLPPTLGRIYDLVRRAMPDGIEPDALHNRLYGDLDRSPRCLWVNIYHANNILRRDFALEIRARHGRYFLQPWRDNHVATVGG